MNLATSASQERPLCDADQTNDCRIDYEPKLEGTEIANTFDNDVNREIAVADVHGLVGRHDLHDRRLGLGGAIR
jgi:hypothetical protein